jgi:cytochrome c peroxidase
VPEPRLHGRARSAATPIPRRARAALAALAALAPLLAAPRTGLDRPFPPLPAPDPERAALGRLLFFDPVLSRDGTLSCAHCHHPEHGLSDGRPRALGAGGRPLARNAPTLYNVAWRQRLFWDARAASLEQQVFGPLFAPDEMAADPEALLARLRAIPEYRERFARAFADGEVSLGNLAAAIADFERTLVSRDSRYDRFARGEREALSPQERRGLALFRSVHTRCFECHRPPTFDAPLAVGIGVPSRDDGVGALSGVAAQRGQFAVPTLRNVAQTAPYMHDGSLATLEAVVGFYRRGGGRALGVEAARVHEHVRAFEIGDDEAAALVAFLRALSDDSASPHIPEAVPSGLPVLSPRPGADHPEE